jgi:hypothetical protein
MMTDIANGEVKCIGFDFDCDEPDTDESEDGDESE